MTDPNFSRSQPKRIHIYHRGCFLDIIIAHVLHVSTRSKFTLLLAAERYEYESVLPGRGAQSLVERRQQRSSGPIVDNSIAGIDMIEMCSHDNHAFCLPGQSTDQVRLFHTCNGWLGDVPSASGFD